MDQVGDDFGVCVADDGEAARLELAPQLQVVFDDAVVHDRDGAGNVRVCVDLRRAAVRGPPGVPDSNRAREALLRERFLEVAELADRADNLDAVVRMNGEAGRIVAAVFEPPKPVEQDRRRLAVTDVTNDSAHSLTLVDRTAPRTSGIGVRSLVIELCFDLAVRGDDGHRSELLKRLRKIRCLTDNHNQ